MTIGTTDKNIASYARFFASSFDNSKHRYLVLLQNGFQFRVGIDFAFIRQRLRSDDSSKCGAWT
ncbi:MAG: hypothetical protein A2017_13300 [Lentisphaerae bacterium GWF2_44_16]|nr:MAG: hypothetical protein A2017_13300 [Lentisphaerae bacterium GWF2_44_16]